MEIIFCTEIVKLGVVEDESQIARMTQVEEINFQMQVRSANMVSCYSRLSPALSTQHVVLRMDHFNTACHKLHNSISLPLFFPLFFFSPSNLRHKYLSGYALLVHPCINNS